MKARTKKYIYLGGGLLLATGIVVAGVLITKRILRTIPKGVNPVQPFAMEKFMGKWYEIARSDNPSERNLKNTTLEFSFIENGGMEVILRGYNLEKAKELKEKGVIALVDKPNIGKLKISFWRPFYSGYNIIEIDPDYRYALIVGDDLKQFWLLSRKPDMLDEIAQQYLAIAHSYGYDTSNIVWVDQDDY